MIVRNVNQKEVLQSLYRAHGGGEAVMLFDSSLLQGMLFLAQGILEQGKTIEAHTDPYEEIYYILEGEGIMMVEGEKRTVKKGDAIWIPYGAVHAMENDAEKDCVVLIQAALPR